MLNPRHTAVCAASLAAAAMAFSGCSRSAMRGSPEPVARDAASAPAATDAINTARPEFTIPAGTHLHVRLDESLGTRHDRTGERFYATLAEPVSENGRTILPAGTRFMGHLTESKPSGRLKGKAVLAVRLDGFNWRGQEFRISTSSIERETRGRKRHDFAWIGGGGGLGAVIGGIAGGGGGALIGGAAGAGAGTAGALISGRKQVHMGAETPLIFELREPVRL